MDDFARQKLERDLIELQRLIDIHFEERIVEENELGGKLYTVFDIFCTHNSDLGTHHPAGSR